MTDRMEQMEQELELLKAEAKFREKKAAGKVTDKDRAQLRAARQEFRDKHRQPAETGAQPDAVGASADVKE